MTASISLAQSKPLNQSLRRQLLNKPIPSRHSNTIQSISRKHMEPGIYDISNEAYHMGSGLNCSVLLQFKH